MWSPTKEKHITRPIHDSQTRAINRTTNMPKATHKGITSPTLGKCLVSLLCLHQLMEILLNHRANKKIMLEGQDLNKRELNLTLSQ